MVLAKIFRSVSKKSFQIRDVTSVCSLRGCLSPLLSRRQRCRGNLGRKPVPGVVAARIGCACGLVGGSTDQIACALRLGLDRH